MATQSTVDAQPETATRVPAALAATMIIGGLLGLMASFALMKDDITLLGNQNAHLACSVNAIVQCGKNILSWQGRVFGFANPMIGLVMFPAPVIVGAALVARARFATWFWWLFNLGHLFAVVFVFWLAYQSIFSLSTLCPWCSVVYVAVVPMFVGVTVHNLRAGRAGRALARVGAHLVPWTVLIVIVGYLAIFGAAQLHLNVLGTLF